jgi:hypothetical protein
LGVNGIRYTLSDCSVSVDGDLDAHDPLHALLSEALNKHFFTKIHSIRYKIPRQERKF